MGWMWIALMLMVNTNSECRYDTVVELSATHSPECRFDTIEVFYVAEFIHCHGSYQKSRCYTWYSDSSSYMKSDIMFDFRIHDTILLKYPEIENNVVKDSALSFAFKSRQENQVVIKNTDGLECTDRPGFPCSVIHMNLYTDVGDSQKSYPETIYLIQKLEVIAFHYKGIQLPDLWLSSLEEYLEIYHWPVCERLLLPREMPMDFMVPYKLVQQNYTLSHDDKRILMKLGYQQNALNQFNYMYFE